jgi:hypothetical protein
MVRIKLEEMYEFCKEQVFGFTSLIHAAQGLMAGYFLSTGEVTPTFDMEDTLQLIKRIKEEFVDMTDAWGFEA